MRKGATLFSIVIVVTTIICGCDPINQENANKEKEVKLHLSPEDYPFLPGDIVLLKPDNNKVVIINTAYSRGTGVFRIKYDSSGTNYTKEGLVRITDLQYKVRCVVNQEWRRSHILDQDEPTEILHYKEMIVN